MNDALFTKLQNFRSALNSSHLERESVIDGLLATVLSRQNAFLLGVPGTGKSDLVRSICNGISDAKYFGYLLSPTTDPSEVFGPVAVTKLLNDEYTRDIEGYLPSCNIAFLDELFRGNSAILNSLLTLLNERTFNNGKVNVSTPIESIVAATNSWPDEESLQAFGDRFLFRPTVSTLKKPISKATLDRWSVGATQRPQVGVHLTLKDLKDLQRAVDAVQVEDNFLEKFSSVWDVLEQRGIGISDRRRVQVLKFLKAWVVVQGETELCPEHMHGSLIHIVYQTEDDKEIIQEVLNQEIPTADRVFADAKRAAAGIMAEYNAQQSKHVHKANIETLNEFVFNLKRYYKDMSIVYDKVNEILDGSKLRLTFNARATGVKLIQQLQGHKDTLARAVNDLSSN